MLFRIENFDIAPPTFAVVVRLARALSASLEWLSSDDGLGEELTSRKSIVLNSKARRAILATSQNLEVAIAHLNDSSETSTAEKTIVSNPNKSQDAKRKRP